MTDAAAPRPSHRLYAVTIGLALLVILLDQASKFWAEATLTVGESTPIIGDLLRFQLIYNPGAAFSIGVGFTWIFTIIAAVAVVALAIFAWRVTSPAWAILLGLLLGGATSSPNRAMDAAGSGPSTPKCTCSMPTAARAAALASTSSTSNPGCSRA